jgi:thiol-disulfide isomerase/thioredoxin
MKLTHTLSAAALALSLVTGSAVAAPAAELVNRIEQTGYPERDPARMREAGYADEYRAAVLETARQRASLIIELYEADPANDELGELLPELWQTTTSGYVQVDGYQPISHLESFLKDHPKHAAAQDAHFFLPLARLASIDNDAATNGDVTRKRAFAEIDRYVETYPDDANRGAMLMSYRADFTDPLDHDGLRAAHQALVDAFPDSRMAGMSQSLLRKLDHVGKPFAIDFTDVVTGNRVNSSSLRGKVVVIDFWATWCGPCVAELPHMKELYEAYHDKGVEFVGISLDQNAEALTSFVEERELPWPQYYDKGKVSSRQFATQWEIASIPQLFIIDAKGVLRSVAARGKLDTLIPRLIYERDHAGHDHGPGHDHDHG